MKRGRRAIIEVDGQKYMAQYLGKGVYSRAYRVGDRAVLYTKDDCAKEVLAMFANTRMMHIPEVIRHRNLKIDNAHWLVFSSPFYRDVTAKDRSAYDLMMKMIRYYNKYWDFYSRQGFRGYRLMEAFIAGMADDGEFPNSVIRAMTELLEVSGNCGEQIGFDIHKKNFGVNDYGVLIFRDLVNPLTPS